MSQPQQQAEEQQAASLSKAVPASSTSIPRSPPEAARQPPQPRPQHSLPAVARLSSSKPYKGPAMEGFIARWYDRNRQLESDHRRLLSRLQSLLPANAAVLEVACGPGQLSIALAQVHADYRVVGLDISHTFIELATQHARDAGVELSFVHGNAAALPFDSASFDCIVCVAAFKNFSQPVQAIQEMHRVLRPSGRAFIVDLRRDATMADIRQYVDKTSMGFVSRHFTLWVFRWFLCKKAYSREEMEKMVAETEFRNCDIQEADITLELMLMKH